jgi:hypothetical protein
MQGNLNATGSQTVCLCPPAICKRILGRNTREKSVMCTSQPRSRRAQKEKGEGITAMVILAVKPWPSSIYMSCPHNDAECARSPRFTDGSPTWLQVETSPRQMYITWRYKIGQRTQMKEEISSIDSEEVIPQSHVSFCRLMQALARYRRKTKSGRAYHIGARHFTCAKNPCHSSPAGKHGEGLVYRLGNILISIIYPYYAY